MDPAGLRVTTPSGQVDLSADRNHVLGRGRDCDIVIADGRVSRRHVLLEPRGDDGWLVKDVSSNGIWSDGTRTSSVSVNGGEVQVRLGAANGPVVVLVHTRPTPKRSAPADPDVADQETMLAGQGGRGPGPGTAPVPVPGFDPRQPRDGRPPAGQPAPPWTGQPLGAPVPPQPGYPAPELVGAGVGAGAGSSQGAGGGRAAPSRSRVWLRALPTFVWLGAVGFSLGALIALS